MLLPKEENSYALRPHLLYARCPHHRLMAQAHAELRGLEQLPRVRHVPSLLLGLSLGLAGDVLAALHEYEEIVAQGASARVPL